MDTMKLYTDIVWGNYEIEFSNGYLQNDNSAYCYLALISALKRDLASVERYLLLVDDTKISEIDRAVCLEAEVVKNYFSGNFSEMEKYAAQAVALNNRAFFARSLIARVGSWKKNYQAAIEHYKFLLELYPHHSNILLDLADCMLACKGGYHEILGYVINAKRSFRRAMYLILIPLGKPLIRLVWALLALALFSLPKVGIFLFGVMSMLIVLALLVTLIKVKLDALIITRLIGLQGINMLMWLLAWFASKYW